MTRAQGTDDEIDYAGSGSPGSERLVVVLRTGALATIDPDPSLTRRAGVYLVLVHLEGPELADPPAFGGQTPARSTALALSRIAERESPGAPVALVAERDTVAIALSLAADTALVLSHLVLVSPVVPEERLERDLALPTLAAIGAPTLLVAAETEPATVEAVRWYAECVPDSTSVVLPAGAVDAPDGRLGLGDAWAAVLEHLTSRD